MMSQHLTSMFEQLGNFKNNLSQNSKAVKEKETKTSANHVGAGGGSAGNAIATPAGRIGVPLLPPALKKPCKLRNIVSKAESYDTLYSNCPLVVSTRIKVVTSYACTVHLYNVH
uniref:SFRICE_017238 n=1 Tax=Spodoptera frugiperda TaxID=7108 RepID=A0A2H1W028_SPOFR